MEYNCTQFFETHIYLSITNLSIRVPRNIGCFETQKNSKIMIQKKLKYIAIYCIFVNVNKCVNKNVQNSQFLEPGTSPSFQNEDEDI